MKQKQFTLTRQEKKAKYKITAYTVTSVQVILSVDSTFSGLSIMATAHGRHIFFTPTPLLGSPAPATILTSPSSATGPGNLTVLQQFCLQ